MQKMFFAAVVGIAGWSLAAVGVVNCGTDCTKTLTCGSGSPEGTGGGGGESIGDGAGGGVGGVGGDGGLSGGAGGRGGEGGEGAAPPVPVGIAAGIQQSCATLSDGSARCWGSNAYGQLANGTTADSVVPVLVALDDVALIDSGLSHSCALRFDGTVWCVGRNHVGQLGDGTTTDSTIAVQVIGITTATQISLGNNSSCARLADSTARCWGNGQQGQLGNGSTSHSSTPVSFDASNVEFIAAGGTTTCALQGTGGVRCAGYNEDGQLGNGSAPSSSSTPVAVSGVSDATAVSTGIGHSCIVRTSGKVSCWGFDVSGQIGDGSAGASQGIPADVVNVSGAVSVSVDGATSCALLNDGSVRCWGAGQWGQLGNGQTPSGATATPVQVLGLTNATTIALGGDHACVLKADETAHCWGRNQFGQLGNGNTTNSSQPTPVTGL
jgi:alpha-tubulin suppressor-like RCC1 family protein